MTKHIDVLDRGFVRLVRTSGNDKDVVAAARVSHDNDNLSAQHLTSGDKKLIAYLAKHHHTSPFEHVTFTFEIKCPIFVARQWMRHRTWSYNEISGRYVELNDEFYLPSPEDIGVQGTANKQARYEAPPNPEAVELLLKASAASFAAYQELLDSGVPREVARMILPLNTYTRFYGTVNLNNLTKFIKLRDHAGAQDEIQAYAVALYDLAEQECPVSMGELMREDD